MALRSLASRLRGSPLHVRAPCPCARVMKDSTEPQGGQQAKGVVDLYPAARPIDLLPEAKWMNVKEDGAGIHTSAPRVPPPAPCTLPLPRALPMYTSSQGSAPRLLLPGPRTTPLAGGQHVFCRGTSLQVASFGVPALPLARHLSRPGITAYGLTCFGQQRRGLAQMPFQQLDSKTAAAKYEQLSPEGRRVADLTNMVFNETVKKMKESDSQRFERINKDVQMLVHKVKVIGRTTAAVVVLIGLALFHAYGFVKEVVEDLSGHSGEIGSALYQGYKYSICSWFGKKFEWDEKWGKKKEAAENSEAPAKK